MFFFFNLMNILHCMTQLRRLHNTIMWIGPVKLSNAIQNAASSEKWWNTLYNVDHHVHQSRAAHYVHRPHVVHYVHHPRVVHHVHHPRVLHVDLAGVVEGGKQGPPAGDGYLIYWLEGDHFAYHSTSFYQHQAEEQWQKIHSRSKWVGLGTWPHRALPQFSAKKERWEKKPKICFGLLKYVCIFTLTRDDTPKKKNI